MQQYIDCVKDFFEANFVQESTLIVMSVVFGGIITVIVNNGAMKKQSRFDMRRKIIEELLEQSQELQRKIEYLEIAISFKKITGDEYVEAVNQVQHHCLLFNEALRSKRKFVFTYVKAVAVEESAEIVSKFIKAMCYFGDGGITDIRVKTEVNNEMIGDLRCLTKDARLLNNALTESLEKLSSPTIIARVVRKIRPAWLFIGECYAIWKISLKNKKKRK